MRRSLALLSAAVASAVMAASATGALQPRFALVDDEPLVVRGAAFAPGERVTVTALTLLGPKRVVTKAGAGGAFRASLSLVGRPCGRAFTILATGTRGSRATLRLAIAPCIPPPMD